MKRYDPEIEWFYGYEAIPEAVMEEIPKGDYVKYTDVELLIEVLMKTFRE